MTLSTTNILSQEEEDALQKRVDLFNNSVEHPLTLAAFVEQHVIAPAISQLKQQMYDTAVTRISTLAQSLPYNTRKSLIQELEERFT